MYKFHFAAILSLLICSSVLSQDAPKARKVKFLLVPVLGYSPETRTYAGAVTLFTFDLYGDAMTRTSNAKIEFNATWKEQIIMESEWNYFFKGEEWFCKGNVHYSQYPDFYYGIGLDTPSGNQLVFDSNRFMVDAHVLKKIAPRVFAGLNVKYRNYARVETANRTLNYPELMSGSTLGIGCSLLRDTRNSLLTPTRGAYVYLNASYDFAKSNYWGLTLDLRYYKTWKDRFTFAGRFINDFNFGNPPFFDHAVLGGDKFVRGYYYGRYRDKNLCSWQGEFRFPAIWRFGVAAFGGVATVFPDADHFALGNLKHNIGLGIRFLVDKKDRTNLRLDYARGQDGNDGFYISFGESF